MSGGVCLTPHHARQRPTRFAQDARRRGVNLALGRATDASSGARAALRRSCTSPDPGIQVPIRAR